MPTVLRTKLFVPQQPTAVINRPRLTQKLDQGLTGKLSLITAPPGYGKTTLVTSWLKQQATQQDHSHTIWFSIDERDNDLHRFLTYFVAALSQLDGALNTLHDTYLQNSSESLDTESLIIELINQFAEFEDTVIFVLDDYHEIDRADIHDALAFWLENQPPNFHLVLTSRTQPPLPLPRLRVRRHVTEIDATHLRFTPEETADFLNQHMGLNLSAEDIAQLDMITEGWVASLQLAAISLQNQPDTAAFIQTFKGNNRYIVDYLVHEVLARQPEHIRDFLLQTSVLERLNGELCTAVTENRDSQELLEKLDQSRLFVIPLDSQRRWYRYHHLFADCLHAELERTATDKVALYHERASRWLEANDFLSDAIQHAFTANNMPLAAEMVGRNGRAILSGQGANAQLHQWLGGLPETEIARSPQLLIIKAWLRLDLYFQNEESIDDLLDQATQLIELNDSRANPYSSDQLADMNTEIALARANQERLQGNMDLAIQLSEKALQVASNAVNPILKIGARGSLATIYYITGKINRFLEFGLLPLAQIDQLQTIHYARYVFISYLFDAWRLKGEMTQARQLMQRIETPYKKQSKSAGVAILNSSWAEILREQNELEQALELALSAIERLRPLRSMVATLQATAITAAHIYQAQGKAQEALLLLQNVGRNHPLQAVYFPSARLQAAEALIHLRQGRLAAAQAWSEKSGLSVDDDVDFLYEIDYLVFARILLANGAFSAVQKLLEKIEHPANENGRVARLIEIYTLQALTENGLGRKEKALTLLGKALDYAQAGGFKRIIVDEGVVLVPLLQQIAGRGLFVTYIQQILSLFGDIASPTPAPAPQTAVSLPMQMGDPAPLLNPLTDRELATLRYLATNLTIPEIAEQMIVAPSTIRTYVKRIYSKLDVHNRIEAVNRARALSLV